MILLVVAFCGTLVLIIRPISDGALEKRFVKHRHEFERLVAIVASDPEVYYFSRDALSRGVVFGMNSSGRPMPESRIHSSTTEILQLLDLLGCYFVARSDAEITVTFRRHGFEDLYPGGFKVIAICSNRPASVVTSIDDFRRQNRGTYQFYQQLDGPWYIKYEEAH